VGNRLTAEGVADNWSYNDNNELQGYDGVRFEYDDNGNMTQKTDSGQVTRYIYNVEDRLERVEDGSGSLISSYYYGPFGRRLWKEVNGVRTYFVYGDEGLVAEVDAAGDAVKSYGYRPGSTWTTDPLFMKVGGQYYFYQNDHLGTPQKLTAVNGAVAWSAKYSSFGEADVDIFSTVSNNLRFPGQYLDQETDLHYNYNRYFDPKSGRYLTSDPIGLLGGINYYLYASSNPSNEVDPLGLAEYIVTFETKSITPIKNVGAIKVKGTIILPTQDKNGRYLAMDFEGNFVGGSGGLPFGDTTDNIGLFTDSFETPSFNAIEGTGLIIHTWSFVSEDNHISGPLVIRFGDAHMKEMADTSCGLEFSVGGIWRSPNIQLKGKQYLLDKHVVKEYLRLIEKKP
jgi:RHS repeat-associated protein